MIYIISGTDRPGSRTKTVSDIIKGLFDELNVDSEVVCLRELQLNQLDGTQYSGAKPPSIEAINQKLLKSRGLFVVCPEYNGSYPGILKYFIDHWPFPDTYEFRPVAFVGLGGRFGGLRPVEHLQQVFGYRNAFIYPRRVFLANIWSLIENSKIVDEELMDLLKEQVLGFSKFVDALDNASLGANSHLAAKEHSP